MSDSDTKSLLCNDVTIVDKNKLKLFDDTYNVKNFDAILFINEIVHFLLRSFKNYEAKIQKMFALLSKNIIIMIVMLSHENF